VQLRHPKRPRRIDALLRLAAAAAALALAPSSALAATCGNGVVEAGEQCDLGASNGLSTTCCSATCQFTIGTICRPTAAACDQPEYCPGNSASCPADTFTQASGNACSSGDTCDTLTNTFVLGANTCAGVTALTAQQATGGTQLAWTAPVQPGYRIQIYRTSGNKSVAAPGAGGTLVFDSASPPSSATSFLDATAATGSLSVYFAFASYTLNGASGWAPVSVVSFTGGDSDDDGMPDSWELANSLPPSNPLNPNDPGDALADPDNDGLSNVLEYLHHSNPNVADTDGDGINDGREVSLGTDPNNADTDGDGMSDGFEVANGLDPLNPHDFSIGNFSTSASFLLGAYVIDSGSYALGVNGATPVAQPMTSANNQVVIASQQQAAPVGSMGSSGGFGYAGYLYTTEEYLAPNYPPTGNAGINQSVTLPATVQLSGSSTDPNGDPATYAWQFVQVPATSCLNTNPSCSAALVNKNTATPTFTPDVYGYYMLQMTVTDIAGASGAPAYVVITAVSAGQFYVSGPFSAIANNNKMVSQGLGIAGALNRPLTGGTCSGATADACCPTGCTTATDTDCATAAPGSCTYQSASANYQLGLFAGDTSPANLGGAEGGTPNLRLDAGYVSAAFAPFSLTADQAPIANAGSDQTVSFGPMVLLDGSASSDPDGYPNPLTYSWTFWQRPYGSAATITNATSKSASFVPDVAGSYIVLLTVYDGQIYSEPSPVVITVSATPPVAIASTTIGANPVVAQASPMPTITLDGTASHNGAGTPGNLIYAWSFFQKPDNSVAALSNPAAAQPSFVPDRVGYYILSLVVRLDGTLVSAPSYVTVSVTSTTGDQAPVADAGPSQSVTAVNSTGLDGSKSYDPDWDHVTSISHNGLGFNWTILSAPAGSTAYLQCMTAENPVYDCIYPQLNFNGFNGTYVIGLTVVDTSGLQSNQSIVTITANGITPAPPMAVAMPTYKVVNLHGTNTTVNLDGSQSFDITNSAAVLSYSWTLVSKPPSSTASLINPTTLYPQLTPDVPGVYKVHLKVCDNGVPQLCSCDYTKPVSGNCNAQSFAQISTSSDSVRVAMPANWPAVGAQGGSGGQMTLTVSPDGVYDKPIILSHGFSGLPGAVGGASALNGLLRQLGYDTWELTYDPICDGENGPRPVPNLTAPDQWGGDDACSKPGQCVCGVGHYPVDNYMPLNAVVAAYAIQQAKQYGSCANNNSCFVRVLGLSMGGAILQYSLAWAEDPSRLTVPYAQGESAPYALDGARAKPPGQDYWDLGARVYISLDSPHQGANVPPSVLAFARNYEANGPSMTKTGAPFAALSFPDMSGLKTLFVWGFLQWRGLRDFVIDHRAQLKKMMAAGNSWWATVFSDIKKAYKVIGILSAPSDSIPGLLAIGISAGTGFLIGIVAGLKWAVIGAMLRGIETTIQMEIMVAIFATGPWGMLIDAIIGIVDYLLGGFGQFFFNVSTHMDIRQLAGSTVGSFPANTTAVMDSPAAREMLYNSIDAVTPCPDVKMILQGNSVPSLENAPGTFGKENTGELCNGAMQIVTSTIDHDNFYADLGRLNTCTTSPSGRACACPFPLQNGKCGYGSLTRNVGIALGTNKTMVPKKQNVALGLHLPYVVTDQVYPLTPLDHQPGSLLGDVIESHLEPTGQFGTNMGYRGDMLIHVSVFGFDVDDEDKKLFSDWVNFPIVETNWPFIPTQSSLDLNRPAACSSTLPCCQLLPDGVGAHAAFDGQQNCCLCTTGLDASYRPSGNPIHHIMNFSVNPCLPSSDPVPQKIKDERALCANTTGSAQGDLEQMCPNSNVWYTKTNADGFDCNSIKDESETIGAIELFGDLLANLDVQRTCSATSATFVCNGGQTSCAASEGHWIWVGGSDFDGDGCPGQHKDLNGNTCPAADQCETDTQDLDATTIAQLPANNHAPTITSLSPLQTFALPACTLAEGGEGYACTAAIGNLATGAPLTVSVAATDADGDPLKYVWNFEADSAQGQAQDDVSLSSHASPSPSITINTHNRAPQGTYTLSVVVSDNKGGTASGVTTVVVPGDVPPQVAASAPSSVSEICNYQWVDNNANGVFDSGDDASRCYAPVQLYGSVVQPDRPNTSSILFTRWDNITDRTTGYRAAIFFADPRQANALAATYVSNGDAATPHGTPLTFKLTAVNIYGQMATSTVQVPICSVSGVCN